MLFGCIFLKFKLQNFGAEMGFSEGSGKAIALIDWNNFGVYFKFVNSCINCKLSILPTA
jgi:hypothetical protein